MPAVPKSSYSYDRLLKSHFGGRGGGEEILLFFLPGGGECVLPFSSGLFAFSTRGREDRSWRPVVSGHLLLNIRPVSYFTCSSVAIVSGHRPLYIGISLVCQ